MATYDPRYNYGMMNPYGYGRQQEYSPEIVSMYNPQAQNQFIQAAGKRQERFDVAVGTAVQAFSEIAGMETANEPLLRARLNDFESKINKVVQEKYGGDYSAAATEIVQMIGAERSHPFYRYNQEQVNAYKTFQEDARRMGPNFLYTKNPLEVTFDDWQGTGDFMYNPVDAGQVQKQAAQVASNLAKEIEINPQRARGILGDQYFEIIKKAKISSLAELKDFLSQPAGQQLYQQVYNSMPILSEIQNQGAVEDAILTGFMSAIGGQDTQYLQDRAFDTSTGGFGGAGLISVRETVDIGKYPEKREALEDLYKQYIVETDPEAQKIFKEAGVSNYEELKQKYLEEQGTIGQRVGKQIGKTGTGPPRFEAPGVTEDVYTETYQALEEYLNPIVKKRSQGITLDIYEIDQLNAQAQADSKTRTALKAFQDVLDDTAKKLLTSQTEALHAFTKEGEQIQTKMDPETVSVTGFSYDPWQNKFMLAIQGKDNKGKFVETLHDVDEPNQAIKLINYIISIEPELGKAWNLFE